jgi:MYXO-CTERM domain-containing protein
MLALISCLFPVFATEVDTIGGEGTYNNNGDMMKLVYFTVEESAAVTGAEFAVYNYQSSSTIRFALYAANTDLSSWDLVDAVDNPVEIPDDSRGWAGTGEVVWLLEAGRSYAMGVWIGSDWYYYYDEGRSESPWFGETAGSFRIEDEVPESFSAEREEYFYWMRITSEIADLDGDGLSGAQWGGTDCDDEDPGVGVAGEEIPYDGIDQDCDGADLTDQDGDGADAEEAGGQDCDDGDAEILPGAAEICGDDLDNDCTDGPDTDCTGSGEDKSGLSIDGGCACSNTTGSGAGAFGGLLMLAVAAGARRR